MSSPGGVTARLCTLAAITPSPQHDHVNISHQLDDGVRPSLLWRQGRPNVTDDGETHRIQTDAGNSRNNTNPSQANGVSGN